MPRLPARPLSSTICRFFEFSNGPIHVEKLGEVGLPALHLGYHAGLIALVKDEGIPQRSDFRLSAHRAAFDRCVVDLRKDNAEPLAEPQEILGCGLDIASYLWSKAGADVA